MKYVILVPDGMADRPIKELGGKTPLEAADTPNMDLIASRGSCGMAKTFYKGLPYDSSIANMSILGYDPRKYFTGRSPLEAANLGVELGAGDLALRCNLITVDDWRIKDFTAGHISSAEAAELMGVIDRKLGGDGIEFYPGVSYRHLLVLRDIVKPSIEFTATPPHDIVGGIVSDNLIKAKKKTAQRTVDLLNGMMEKSRTILEDNSVNKKRVKEGKNPANSIWLWGAGTKPAMPTFESKYKVTGSLVSAVDLLKGLGRIVRMEVLNVQGATGYLDTNYEGKADAALKSLEHVDLTYVHVESTDEAGHEGSLEHKLKAIEDIDKKVIGRILDGLKGDFAILLMPDHATPVSVKTHTEEPVPYAIYDTRKKGSGVSKFTEKGVRDNWHQNPTDAYKLVGRLIKG
jgi:2,3-bisphosphoglycerate-independent phosphoglycerate mutase